MVRFQNVSLFFGERVLFDQISFTLSAGEKLAVCGRNGTGKSTLFKLMLKELMPDGGSIEYIGNVSIGILKQELPPDRGLALFDEVKSSFADISTLKEEYDQLEYKISHAHTDTDDLMDMIHRMEEIRVRLEHLDIDKLDGKIEKVLLGLGFTAADFERKISMFSGGWRMRIELAKLLLSKPDLLLLDEPNNHLDIVSIRWLEKYLKEYEGTVIIISHDLSFMDRLANRIIEIDRGKIYDYKGNYSSYKLYRAERKQIELNEYKAQQKIIQQKEMLIEKFRYKASKASFAQSLITELNRMDKKEIPEEEQGSIKLRFKSSQKSGNKVLEIKDLAKSFGDKEVLKQVNYFLERGHKISLIGANGNGKTTLVKMIVGDLESSGGSIEFGHNVKIGYYAQESEDTLNRMETALETVENYSNPEMRTQVRKILGGLGFAGEEAEKKIAVLSGGEKARIRLAKLIVNEHNLLILDEPTHHLDLASKEKLKDALKNYDGTVLIVSHDRDFLKELADKTILFENKGITIFEGDIDYYLEKTEENTVYDLPVKQGENKSIAVVELDYNERKKAQRKIQNLERDIEKFEANLLEMQKKMEDPEFYQSTGAAKLMEEYERDKQKLKECMDAWENVSSLLG